MAATITEKIWNLCQVQPTVSSVLADDSTQAPSKIAEKLYNSHGALALPHPAPKDGYHDPSPEELERAYQCGQFGASRPSDLFLKVWHDALTCLEHDPLAGVVSPPLMGSNGNVPFTVIAGLPDIARHMSNLIVRAKTEVILATNYWKESDASTLITDALRELSKRAGERGTKVVVKIIYDRGSIKQVLHNHLHVTEKEWSASGIAIPASKDVPHLHLEVQNYHTVVLGTFHSKFMVVDKQIALTQSNNIQDNDNMEMMVQLEGDIVRSPYDMALVSWHDAMEPPLPLSAKDSAPSKHITTLETQTFLDIVKDFPNSVLQQIRDAHTSSGRLPAHNPGSPHYDTDLAAEMIRMQSQLTPIGNETAVDLVCAHLNAATKQTTPPSAPDFPPHEEMTPFLPSAPSSTIPIALVNRKPYGPLSHSSVHVPQNAAWLAAIRHARESIFTQSPDINAAPLLPALIAAVKRGVDVTLWACLGYNDLGELLPYQGGTNEQMAAGLYKQLDEEEKQRLHVAWYVAKDQTRPLHNRFKQRSCHIKILIADSHLAIQGSGNQDTQSWYHSQEVNILLDSAQVCGDWLAALHRNQNTGKYGLVDPKDGIWRDEQGKEAEGAMGTDVGHFAWMKGVVGAVQRAQGKGGF